MDAWPPQASYPCGNYSDTSGMICSSFLIASKGSLASLSQSRFVLEIVNQASLYAFVPREISVPTELALGHLRCRVTDMPPQPNSPSGRCLETRFSGPLPTPTPARPVKGAWGENEELKPRLALNSSQLGPHGVKNKHPRALPEEACVSTRTADARGEPRTPSRESKAARGTPYLF